MSLLVWLFLALVGSVEEGKILCLLNTGESIFRTLLVSHKRLKIPLQVTTTALVSYKRPEVLLSLARDKIILFK